MILIFQESSRPIESCFMNALFHGIHKVGLHDGAFCESISNHFLSGLRFTKSYEWQDSYIFSTHVCVCVLSSMLLDKNLLE